MPEVLGVGYDYVERVLGGDFALKTVVLLAVLKIVATADLLRHQATPAASSVPACSSARRSAAQSVRSRMRCFPRRPRDPEPMR